MLKLIAPASTKPLSFDMLDTQLDSIKGGELVTLVSTASTTDLSASTDGYVNSDKRVVATLTITSGARPLFLTDDGTKGYGTQFGTVLGGVAGKDCTGVVVGPSTARASGMVSAWLAHGTFGVSLDAVDQNATTGLQPTNATLNTGAAIYVTAAGILTPNVSAAVDNTVVGRFIEFSTDGSLVTTKLDKKWVFADINFSQPS